MFYDSTWLERILWLKRLKGGGSSAHEATSYTGIFETDMVAPLKELLLTFAPYQSGSGDTSPSNIRPISGWSGLKVQRSGKNLINDTGGIWTLNAYINAEGAVSSNNNYKYTTDLIPVKPNTTYYVQEYKTLNTASGITVPYYRADGTFIQRVIPYVAATGTGIKGGSFTTTADTHFIRISCEKNAYNIMLELGSTRSDYEAYNGQNFDVIFPALGKNLLNVTATSQTISGVTFTVNVDKTITVNGTATDTITLNIGSSYFEKDVEYIVSGNPTGSSQSTYQMQLMSGSKVIKQVYSGDTSYTHTEDETLTTRIVIRSGQTVSNLVWSPMIRLSNQSSGYEPYNNNVYGGTLDVTTGELTVTWSGVVMDGTVNKASNCRQISDTSEYTYLRGYYVVDFVDLLNTIPYNSGESICSHFTWYSYSSRRAARPDSIYFASSARVVYWCSSEYTTLEEFNEYLQDEYAAGRPVTLVYPRGSSTITYQLTPQQIKTLKGLNVITSDAEVTEVVYMTRLFENPLSSAPLMMGSLKPISEPVTGELMADEPVEEPIVITDDAEGQSE